MSELRFASIAWYDMSIGRVASVRLDRRCNDFDWIIGHEVEIDGKAYRVKDVERFAHAPPWRVGEEIGLLVAPPAVG